MSTEEFRAALAKYVSILEESARTTHRAEDRSIYEKHLANSAKMFLAIESEDPLGSLKRLVSDERRFYGWGYLSGAAGEAAESAFNEFAEFIAKAT